MPLTDKSTTQSYTPSIEELNRSVSFEESLNPQEEKNIRTAAARLDLNNNRMEFDGRWLSALAKEEAEVLKPKTEALAQAATNNQVEKTITEYSLSSQEPETTYTELAAKPEKKDPLNEQWAAHLGLYGLKIMEYRAKAKK